jgi:hypothetical protein
MKRDRKSHRHVYCSLSTTRTPLQADIDACHAWLAGMDSETHDRLITLIDSAAVDTVRIPAMISLGAPEPKHLDLADYRGYLFVMDLPGRSTTPCARCPQ